MKGVILAAGKGTRLYPVTRHIAKPLLPIAGRLTLDYAFEQLKGMGITEVCVVVGENENAIREALGDGSEYGVELHYSRQIEPKGLAHAVGFAKDFVGDDSFVLYLGDAVYDRSLAEFAKKFEESGCANLNLVMWVEDPRRFGVANLEGDRIVKLVEKPQEPESNYAMAGMYIFGPQIWSVLPDLQPSARGEYEITDAIQTLVDRGEDVRAGIYEGNWFDTGTLDSYLETTAFLLNSQSLMGHEVALNAPIGSSVVIGDRAIVNAGLIEDSAILPGAKVNVNGTIRHCLLAGTVNHDGDLENAIFWGDERN
ncbi:MAG: NTP transferase domain-containing protein [Chthonomonas sp.]|nr:NTP transferase domain-containing protein [Chthonomonas sp.]